MDNRWPRHEVHRKRVMNNLSLVEKGTFIKNQTQTMQSLKIHRTLSIS